jgi:hypothetical protein
MTTATLPRKHPASLNAQIRQAKAILRQLQETLEDLDDRMMLAKAKKKNAGKPGLPWRDVAKELGISAPARKR